MDEINITGNIRMIETLKNELLNHIADLFTVMSSGDSSERNDILANMIILTYTLAQKTGMPYTALDEKILHTIKLSLLDEKNTNLQQEMLLLSKHIDKYRAK